MTTYTNVTVVGMHFRGAEVKELVSTFTEGVKLRLEREPDNPYDPNAVKVFYEDTHIGYINKKDASFISDDLIDREATTIVTEMAVRRNNLHPICSIEIL